MKKLMSLMLGMSLALGSVAVIFAQPPAQPEKKEAPAKKKKKTETPAKKKKKTEEPKKEG